MNWSSRETSQAKSAAMSITCHVNEDAQCILKVRNVMCSRKQRISNFISLPRREGSHIVDVFTLHSVFTLYSFRNFYFLNDLENDIPFLLCSEENRSSKKLSKFLKITVYLLDTKACAILWMNALNTKMARTCSGQRENISLQFIEIGMRIIA